MTNKILTLLLVGLTGVVFTAPAGAAQAPHRYSPHPGAKCRPGYQRVANHRRHHKTRVFCVKKAARKKATPGSVPPSSLSTPLAEKAKLHSHLDPTFTRDPLNPFKVTYAYRASASQEAAPEARALGAVEEPAPLPSGVLSLFSDGKLECAINVGSGTEGSECPVSYSALGQHTVTTIYTSGEQSATETEVEQIDPLPTTTSLALSYQDLPGGPEVLKQYGHCEIFTGSEYRCQYDYEWLLGELVAEGGSSLPSGNTQLSCPAAGLTCPSAFDSHALNGQMSAPVVLKANAFIRYPAAEHPDCEELHAIVEGANQGEWSYPTQTAVVATSQEAGYQTSQESRTLSFEPALPC